MNASSSDSDAQFVLPPSPPPPPAPHLYLIGLGLGDLTDLTLRGFFAIHHSSHVYLEQYTAVMASNDFSVRLSELLRRNVIIADRDTVESFSNTILRSALSPPSIVSLLVVGDPLAATTHSDLMLRAEERGVGVTVVHNASIVNAVASCGLSLYQFGQTVSIPFFDSQWRPTSFYENIRNNIGIKLHTLCLLDIKVKEQTAENVAKGIKVYEGPRYMSVNSAVKQLLEIEDEMKMGVATKLRNAIGCARIGHCTQRIVSGTLSDLLNIDFGPPLHSLVVLGCEYEELNEIEKTMFNRNHWNREEMEKKKKEEGERWEKKMEEERMSIKKEREEREKRMKEREDEKKREKDSKALALAATRSALRENRDDDEPCDIEPF